MKSQLTYNPIDKEVSYTTQEGINLILKCPKLSLLINLRKVTDKDFLDDIEMLVRFFTSQCITNPNFTFEHYLDLSIRDGIEVMNALSYFIPKSELFNVWYNLSSDKALSELRKALLLSVNNDTNSYFNLLEKDLDDVLVILEDWMELRIDEYEQTTGKKHPSRKRKGMSGLELAKMGIDENIILSAIEED